MPHAISRPWTAADLKRMRTYAAKGYSARATGEILKRTRVVAAWDLTDVERAVMSSRLNA